MFGITDETNKPTKTEVIKTVYAPKCIVYPLFFAIGAYFSVCAFQLAHYTLPKYWQGAQYGKFIATLALLLFCLGYSIPTVKDVLAVTWKSDWKAWSSTLLLELAIVFAPFVTALVAVGFMAIINGYVASVKGAAMFVKPERQTTTKKPAKPKRTKKVLPMHEFAQTEFDVETTATVQV